VDELLSDPVWDPKNLESISRDALERFLRYVYDRDLRRDAFLNRMTGFNEFTTLKTQLMTLAEQFREEGREEGHQKGHQAGKAEGLLGAMRRAVLRALEIRHGAVPPELATRVEALDSQEVLDRLHEAAICSCSVEDFARQLPG
jgi:flagellar biosynthesis/type III secretory pathway protein FliH